MERSIIFDKILNVISISVSLIVFVVIMIISPDMKTGWDKYTIIAGGTVLIGILISRLNAIKTSYIKKDWDEKVSELIDCHNKQVESNNRLNATMKEINETNDRNNKWFIFFEQRYTDEFGRIQKELNANKADDLRVKKQVDEHDNSIKDHEKRISVLEKK